MKAHHVVVGAVGGLFAIAVLGCGGAGAGDNVVSRDASPQVTAAVSITASSAPPVVASNVGGLPPLPSASARAAYLAALNAVDTTIVGGKEDRSVDRGRNQCSSISQTPNDRTKLVGLVQQRFSPPQLTAVQAGKVLDAVHTNLCPTYPMS